jgi:hypothetical protein
LGKSARPARRGCQERVGGRYGAQHVRRAPRLTHPVNNF